MLQQHPETFFLFFYVIVLIKLNLPLVQRAS